MRLCCYWKWGTKLEEAKRSREEEREREATNLISFRNSSLMSLNAFSSAIATSITNTTTRLFICLFQTRFTLKLLYQVLFYWCRILLRLDSPLSWGEKSGGRQHLRPLRPLFHLKKENAKWIRQLASSSTPQVGINYHLIDMAWYLWCLKKKKFLLLMLLIVLLSCYYCYSDALLRCRCLPACMTHFFCFSTCLSSGQEFSKNTP